VHARRTTGGPASGLNTGHHATTIGGVEFSRELREDVISGAITVSFRLWRRPKVKEGGRYPVGPAHIEVDSVELVPFAAISEDDLRRTGEKDRESLRRRAAHAGPVSGDTLLYRVEFHLADSPAR
jgi:hypothetical protein